MSQSQFNHSPNQYPDSADAGSTQKTKSIQKSRNQAEKMQELPRDNLTKAQKLIWQKQRNRIAAQASRDKQKQYVQQLENQIVQLKHAVDQQICSNCGGDMSVKQSRMLDDFLDPVGTGSDQLPFISDDSEPEASAVFFRDSNEGNRYYNIGTCLMILFLVMAAGSFLCCLQSEEPSVRLTGRIMQECLPFQILENAEAEQLLMPEDIQATAKQDIENLKYNLNITGKKNKVTGHNLQAPTSQTKLSPSSQIYTPSFISCVSPQILKKKVSRQSPLQWTAWPDNPQMPSIEQMYHITSLYWLHDLSMMGMECLDGQQ